jgi:hypothetical protein
MGDLLADGIENMAAWIDTFAWMVDKFAIGVGYMVSAWEWFRDTVVVGVGGGLMMNWLLGLQTGFSVIKTYFLSALQWIRNLLPGSEPVNSASPLYGLSASGAALMANVLAGMQAFGATVDDSAGSALGLLAAPVTAPLALAGSILGGGGETAGGGAQGLSVVIGDLVFNGPVDTSEGSAEDFVTTISNRLAEELSIALSGAVAG